MINKVKFEDLKKKLNLFKINRKNGILRAPKKPIGALLKSKKAGNGFERAKKR
jgi:hypothetical protein